MGHSSDACLLFTKQPVDTRRQNLGDESGEQKN